MNKKEITEGLGELADGVERDHEVQMARAEVYKIAKQAVHLHKMLSNVSEEEGLEGWVQSKITKSADMIGSVYHHLDYEANAPMAENESLRPAHAKELRNKELNKDKGPAKSGKTTGPDDYDFLKYKNKKRKRINCI